MSHPRASIVVTGSELVRGDRSDLNGPFLAAELVRLGLEPGRITIVGDRPAELAEALAEGVRSSDLLLVSGGLGPTHDDRTIELLAAATGRALVVDQSLEAEIGAISRGFADRMNRPYADFETGVTKQATLPEGAISIGLAGTAPGVVLEAGDCVAVTLPGPPRELQKLWPNALASAPVQRVLAAVTPPTRRVLRFFGVSESAVARALADAGGDGDGVEVTICAREFELYVDLFVSEGAEQRADELERRLLAPVEQYLFARDERRIEQHVLDLCREQGLTLSTAESCTGGLVSGRLTSVPGSSDVFVGGIVAYGNQVKADQLGVRESVLAEHGAVSAETAAAMAAGARARLGADVSVAVTGVAGPDGGTPEKPVGLVFIHAEGPHGHETLRVEFPGDRELVRLRATVGALHAVRRLLAPNRHE